VGNKAHERLIVASNAEVVFLPLKPYPLVGTRARNSFSKQVGCDVVVGKVGIQVLPGSGKRASAGISDCDKQKQPLSYANESPRREQPQPRLSRCDGD
jgi:hypothetical protein